MSRSNNRSRGSGWPSGGALLPIAAVLLLAGCSLWPADTNPFTTIHPSTDFGEHIQNVYAMVTYWVVGIAVVVLALLAFTLVRFRDDGKPGNPEQVHGNPQMEFGWTLLPVFIVIAITVPTIRTIWLIGDAAPADALEVRVIGKRWWWEFEYIKEKVVTANELHLPAGRPISLLIESDSVIHSFWVPRLGGKRDAVPGRVNRMWFTIKDTPKDGEAIEYLGECAEFCGVQHAMMRKRVYAHTEADFQKWVSDMKEPVRFADASVQSAGEAAFSAGGCAGCHAITGNKAAVGRAGPNLTRFGQRHSVGAGMAPFDARDGSGAVSVLSEDAKSEILHKWLNNPNDVKPGSSYMSKPGVKEGDANSEPSRIVDGMNLPRQLTPDEIDALTKYLLAMK